MQSDAFSFKRRPFRVDQLQLLGKKQSSLLNVKEQSVYKGESSAGKKNKLVCVRREEHTLVEGSPSHWLTQHNRRRSNKGALKKPKN